MSLAVRVSSPCLRLARPQHERGWRGRSALEGLPEAAPACRPQEGSWAGRIVGRDDWPAQSPVRGSPACALAWASVPE